MPKNKNWTIHTVNHLNHKANLTIHKVQIHFMNHPIISYNQIDQKSKKNLKNQQKVQIRKQVAICSIMTIEWWFYDFSKKWNITYTVLI